MKENTTNQFKYNITSDEFKQYEWNPTREVTLRQGDIVRIWGGGFDYERGMWEIYEDCIVEVERKNNSSSIMFSYYSKRDEKKHITLPTNDIQTYYVRVLGNIEESPQLFSLIHR